MKFKAKKITMIMGLFRLFVLFLNFFCHSLASPFRSSERRRGKGNPDSINKGLDSRLRGNDRRGVRIFATIIFIGLCFIVFGYAGSFVSAASTDNASYVPLAPLPGTTSGDCTPDKNGKTPPSCTTDLNTYIPGAFNLAIGVAGVLAVIMIMIGGVEYMTTDAIGGKTDAKGRISNALWGLLLVLVSWILLHTINPQLTIFDLSVGPVTINKQNVQQNTTDNSYINKGNSATGLEQSENNTNNSNVFENPTGSTKNSQYQGGMNAVQ